MKYVFLNGRIVSEAEGFITLNDRGFLYGDGIFETLRSYEGTPFLLTKHLRRLHSSAEKLKIPLEYTTSKLNKNVKDLIKLNNTPDAYIRITLSRGTGSSGVVISDDLKPTLLIQVKPFVPYERGLYKKGMSLTISKARRSITCPISRHKTTNLLTSILLKEEAKRRSAHEAIVLNTDGYVAECIFSNLFIVDNMKVITPSLDTNILPGITRKTVLNICKRENIPAREVCFGLNALTEADEVFITNSLMEIMPVSKIEGIKVGKAIPGKITRHLIRTYKRLIKL